jgi:hypothetical protein
MSDELEKFREYMNDAEAQRRAGMEREALRRFGGELQALLMASGHSSPAEYWQAMAAEDEKWREEKEEREITDLDELLEILTGREVFEAEEANGYHLDTGFSVTFYGNREKDIPADHLQIWPVEENGIARLSIRLARTKWVRIEDAPPHTVKDKGEKRQDSE